MEQYKIQKKLGDGSYGEVYRAIHAKTQEVVAIKKFKQKYSSWDECMQLREIKSLMKLKHHNIITLKEVLKEQNTLYLIFEFLEKDLLKEYMDYKTTNTPMTEDKIRNIIRQVAEGLAFMHKHGFFHRYDNIILISILRDLKPENLLLSGDVVKICDFGLAREIRSRPPYSDYVATRWYRAPEILLKQTNYNSPVDIFALGCIMAELYTFQPLFAGNSEIDQINKLVQTLGTPNQNNWPEGLKLAKLMGFTFQNHNGMDLSSIVKNCSQDGLQLLEDMLKWDPSKRPSAQQILSYPFFSVNKVLPAIGRKNTNDYYRQSRNNFNNRRNVFELEGKNILGEQRYHNNELEKEKGEQQQQQKQQQKFGDSTTNFLDFLDKQMIDKDNHRQKDKKQSKIMQAYGNSNNTNVNHNINTNNNNKYSNSNNNKFGDSTSNFLDLIDQKLQENDKNHNNEKQSRNKQQLKYQKDDKLEDLDRDLFEDDKFNNYKKPNPFKLTKQKDYTEKYTQDKYYYIPIHIIHILSYSISYIYLFRQIRSRQTNRKANKQSSFQSYPILGLQLPYQQPSYQQASSVLPKLDNKHNYINYNNRNSSLDQPSYSISMPQVNNSKLPIYYQSKIQQNYAKNHHYNNFGYK